MIVKNMERLLLRFRSSEERERERERKKAKGSGCKYEGSAIDDVALFDWTTQKIESQLVVSVRSLTDTCSTK